MLEREWARVSASPDPLSSYRQKGWERFQEIGFPRPEQEAFQYLKRKIVLPPAAARAEASGLAAEGICLKDGFFEESLSRVPAPLICLPIDVAIGSYGIFLQHRMAHLLKEETDPFAALNAAFQGRGVFLYLPPKKSASLKLCHLFTERGMATPRLHLYLGRGSQLHLEQTSQGRSPFCNHLIDAVLDEGAQLTLVDRLVGDFQSIRATLKRDSHCKWVLLGENTRTSLYVKLAEENSEAQLFSLAQLEKERESHIHATIEHIAPYTRSQQHVKSVLREKARFSFEGKIFVRPEAQKTEAYQLNNNLLLSEEAIAQAKPNLEIFADDVKASHGATIGQLDEQALFYLRSRGLSFAEARNWLVAGFCKEIYDHAR